jgi:hypothetical protein
MNTTKILQNKRKMKTSKTDKIIIWTCMLIIAVLLFLFVNCNNSRTAYAANTAISEENVALKLKYGRTVRAYNRLLHRIWLGKPAYVEDVLCEYDEYMDLMELLSPADIDEIYTLFDKQDSIDYYTNWATWDSYLGNPGCPE